MSKELPLIIGHRGAAGEAPENTLASFQLAVEQGCQGIELDIHLTQDGEIVVCHDAMIDRTTNGYGRINKMTLEELRQYDAGAWFDEKFEGQKIPLLAEVFDLVPEEIVINVEMKHNYGGKLEQKLLEFLQKRNGPEHVIVSSFNHKYLQRLKKMAPELKIGLLYAANFLDHRTLVIGVDIDVYSLHPQYQLIDKEDIANAVNSGLKVYPYTVNKEVDFQEMIRFGVSGIITDFPGRLHKLLNPNK